MKDITYTMENPAAFLLGAKALASDVRLRILQLLLDESLNIQEISQKLNIPFSTAALNVSVLEESGIILTERQPGSRGSVMKICSRKYDTISFHLLKPQDSQGQQNTFSVSMPIGNYCDCDIHPTCGLVSENGAIDIDDNPRSFYNVDRIHAQLIWFHHGFIEYRFPNSVLQGFLPTQIDVSFEFCSEAPFYRLDWPSDITLWINGTEIGTWTCPGDFGGQRGRLTPDWWPDTSTQYGVLKHWKVKDDGSYIDGNKISPVSISQLKLNDMPYISVRIGIKDNADNVGGINIFGSKFGNHPQDIVLELNYIPANS